MCLTTIIQEYPENQRVQYGWKIFRVTKERKILSCYTFIERKGPYNIGETYKAKEKLENYSEGTYTTGFHYFINKQNALDRCKCLTSDYETQVFKVFAVQIQNIRYEGTECMDGTDIPVNVGQKMIILGQLKTKKPKTKTQKEMLCA